MLVTAWSKFHLFKIFPVKHACLLKEGSFCYIVFVFHFGTKSFKETKSVCVNGILGFSPC